MSTTRQSYPEQDDVEMADGSVQGKNAGSSAIPRVAPGSAFEQSELSPIGNMHSHLIQGLGTVSTSTGTPSASLNTGVVAKQSPSSEQNDFKDCKYPKDVKDQKTVGSKRPREAAGSDTEEPPAKHACNYQQVARMSDTPIEIFVYSELLTVVRAEHKNADLELPIQVIVILSPIILQLNYLKEKNTRN